MLLLVRQNAMSFYVLHYLAMQDMFHSLAVYRSQGDWPVVGWTAMIAFLEDWSHIRVLSTSTYLHCLDNTGSS